MRVMLDPEAVALRDAFTLLFWASMFSGFGNRGVLALMGAAATVAVVVALRRLRAAADDRAYRWQLSLATGAAYVVALGGVVDALPLDLERTTAAVVYGVPLLASLVHWFAVVHAMTRLTDLWQADQLRWRWRRAFRFLVASAIVLAATVVIGLMRAPDVAAFRPGPGADVIVLFFAFALTAFAAFVCYLVAIWKMRSAVAVAARVPVPDPAGAAVSP